MGVAGLEGGCRVRIDAIATSSRDREAFRLMDLPLARGSRCHGVRVGNFLFLSGRRCGDGEGNVVSANTIQAQTPEILSRINKILNAQGLSLEDVCRTFMFMPSTDYRPGYGEARKKVYKAFSPKMNFRRIPEFTSGTWDRTSCCAPSPSPTVERKQSLPAPR